MHAQIRPKSINRLAESPRLADYLLGIFSRYKWKFRYLYTMKTNRTLFSFFCGSTVFEGYFLGLRVASLGSHNDAIGWRLLSPVVDHSNTISSK